MAENTRIEWCDHTFNPWIGCAKVSPACDHCYAERYGHRFGVEWGAKTERRRTSGSTWEQPLRWNAKAARLGMRHRVFCASLADVFDNEVPVEWRVDLFELIRQTPNLDWLLLTKRIGNFQNFVAEAIHHIEAAPDWTECGPPPKMEPLRNFLADWDALKRPPINVWIGATICNQEEVGRDIPKLLAVPAAKRFLSIKPMLGPVNIEPLLLSSHDKMAHEQQYIGNPRHDDKLNWVICGGETGPSARPMHPEWARSLRDQCQAADVPFFFKQWGEWRPPKNPEELRCLGDLMRAGKAVHVYGDDREPDGKFQRGDDHLLRVGKKAAGRLLDGREWNGVPA